MRKAKILTPMDKEFEHYLTKHGCYLPDRGDDKPANLEELLEVMGWERSDIQSDAASLTSWLQRVGDARDREAIAITQGKDTDLERTSFDNLRPLIERSHPDDPEVCGTQHQSFYKGAEIGQVIPRVCQALNSFIVPSMNSRMPILPTFCVEVLPDNFDVSMRQALYHGCIGARAMQALQLTIIR